DALGVEDAGSIGSPEGEIRRANYVFRRRVAIRAVREDLEEAGAIVGSVRGFAKRSASGKIEKVDRYRHRDVSVERAHRVASRPGAGTQIRFRTGDPKCRPGIVPRTGDERLEAAVENSAIIRDHDRVLQTVGRGGVNNLLLRFRVA